MPRQVRSETNLCRVGGLWATGPVQLELPLDTAGLAGLVRASGRLKLTPDFDVFAWVGERWLSTPPLDPEGIARFTLYDLAGALYNRRPSRRDRAEVRASLTRIGLIKVQLTGYDSLTGQSGKRLSSLDNLFDRIVSELDDLGSDSRAIGALRGSTFKVQLAPWLRGQLAAGGYTFLDFATLRRLDGLAKRVWVYLAAERFKPCGEGRSAAHVGLGGPALATLGADSFARHVDARRALARAGKRIVEADDRFESVTVERRAGGWSLVATKLDAAERRHREAEREKFRQALIGSPLADLLPGKEG
jgi:hypothetical protein